MRTFVHTSLCTGNNMVAVILVIPISTQLKGLGLTYIVGYQENNILANKE